MQNRSNKVPFLSHEKLKKKDHSKVLEEFEGTKFTKARDSRFSYFRFSLLGFLGLGARDRGVDGLLRRFLGRWHLVLLQHLGLLWRPNAEVLDVDVEKGVQSFLRSFLLTTSLH